MLIIKKKKFRHFFGLVGVLFLLVFLSGCTQVSPNVMNEEAQPVPKSNLRVIFLDVGQGDSSLIITPENKTILVDGGPDDKVLSELGKFLPLKQKKIDVMILTHPHADHLDGLVDVLKRYEVGEVYYTGVLHTTGAFLEWLKIIRDKNIKMNIVKENGAVEIGGVQLNFLFPLKDLSETKFTNLNNSSIVFKLVYDQTSFLFTGDAEVVVEKELLAGGVDLKADVLKVGHHGSNSSTSEEFLKKVAPESAIISVGKDNDFGHPHLRTLRRLERHNSKIFRTDKVGAVEFVSDGEKIIKK
ncbi:MAG: ComEC/Rec2 family competence protein [Candidatus Magasanikbacteria bacterium]|nr:ComEC/Rec2 family competence protein [Candidatus Magasanikbacteria bacterium]